MSAWKGGSVISRCRIIHAYCSHLFILQHLFIYNETRQTSKIKRKNCPDSAWKRGHC